MRDIIKRISKKFISKSKRKNTWKNERKSVFLKIIGLSLKKKNILVKVIRFIR